ncbi:MAG: DNA polymerase III subunit chi [Proteobacteria bacterium]|nr:DNA polymerase III subunit chi [Pseudomonadota bacterium]NCA28393.1 DNA polymerase III subunit chi [Pseudomonadota bacterium]
MKPEINFYAVEEDIVKAMAPILLKIIDDNKRAIIFVKGNDSIKKIDDSLWTYGRNKFIPHATIFDKDFVAKDQPILISNQEDNINKADYLIFLDEPNIEFIQSFSRSFHFFENSSPCKIIEPNNFYRKIDGKWQKIAN